MLGALRLRAHTRGRGHATPENFELFMLWNAFSSVLRGQFLSKCQLNRCHFYAYSYLHGFTYKNSILFHILCSLLTFSKCQFPFKYTLLDKYQSQSQIQIFHFFALFQGVATKILQYITKVRKNETKWHKSSKVKCVQWPKELGFQVGHCHVQLTGVDM